MARWSSLAPDRLERLERAVTVSNAGSVLLDTYIDRIVQLLTLRFFGAWGTLPHEPGVGDAHRVNRRTAGTTGGAWVADTGSATEETGSYAQATMTYATALTQFRVTRMLQNRARSYGDAVAIELGGKLEDFTQFLEDGTFHGDRDNNANQPNGLLTQIMATSSQIVAVTTAAAGDDMTAALLDQAIDAVKGSDGDRSQLRIYANQSARRKLNALLASNQQFNDKVEIEGGFRVRSYDDIPIVTTSGMVSTYTWNGTRITAFSGSTTEALVVANTEYTQIDDLSPITVVPLAKTSSQHDDAEIYWDGSPVLLNTRGASVLAGIAA